MYEKITLSNGVRLVCEHVDNVRSAAAGIWISNGSRHEPPELNGISHFIEHMLFKGTARRTASMIASEMDQIGGQANAFTTPECTVFYTRTLDTHLTSGMDILFDMLQNSLFAEEGVNLERSVILEEIGMVEDTPEDLANERLSLSVYAGTPLGKPILGTPETLHTIDGGAMKQYLAANYTGPRVVFALSGSFTDNDIRFAQDVLSALPAGEAALCEPVTFKPSITKKKKAIEQNHLCLAFEAPPYTSEERYAMHLLNAVIGSGMSSRLYQSVRERQGLCYSVYSFYAPHADTGLFGIYTATGKNGEQRAVEAICRELREFVVSGASDTELSRVREQLKANMMMGLESTAARMNHIGRSELFYSEVQEPESMIAKYDQISLEDLQRLAEKIFDINRAAFSPVGRVASDRQYRQWLNCTV